MNNNINNWSEAYLNYKAHSMGLNWITWYRAWCASVPQ